MGGETRALFNRGDWNYKKAIGFFENTAVNTVFFLAELDGAMIGYLFLWNIDRSVPWLGVAVHEEFKGRRLGRLLIRHALSYLHERGKSGVLLTTHIVNIRAQGLYKSMGFEEIGTAGNNEILYIFRF